MHFRRNTSVNNRTHVPRSHSSQDLLFLVHDPKLDSADRETLDPNSGNIWPWERRTLGTKGPEDDMHVR